MIAALDDLLPRARKRRRHFAPVEQLIAGSGNQEVALGPADVGDCQLLQLGDVCALELEGLIRMKRWSKRS